MEPKRIMNIFNDTAYIRMGGSAEELKAAQYLQGCVQGMGLEANIVPFDVPMSTIQDSRFQADGVDVTCKGYLCAGD